MAQNVTQESTTFQLQCIEREGESIPGLPSKGRVAIDT